MGWPMKQHQVEEGDRAVARRLFMALCELYPDRYITLIEPHDANDRTPSLSMPAVRAFTERSSKPNSPLPQALLTVAQQRRQQVGEY